MSKLTKPRGAALAACLALALVLTLGSCSSVLSSIGSGALSAIAGGSSSSSSPDGGEGSTLDDLVRVGQAVGKATKEITPEEEYYIGRAVAATVLRTNKPWTGQQATKYINTMGQAVAQVSKLPETYGGYHFLILDTDQINAFGCPGGLVLVSRGLLRCARSEDEVAAILAHEVAHVSLKHGLSAISTARWTEASLELGKFAAKNSGNEQLANLTASFGGVIDEIVNTMVNSGYSRELEKQADLEAVAIMARLGYEPSALAKVLATMKTRLAPGAAGFAKTHPSPDDRIVYLDKATAKIAPSQKAAAKAPARQARYSAAMGGV